MIVEKMENMDRRTFLKSATIFGTFIGVGGVSYISNTNAQKIVSKGADDLPFEKVIKTDAEWKKILTPDQYYITRQAGTEPPYSSPFNSLKDKGTFTCVCCDLPLFSSKTKFDSRSGWASFYEPINKVNVGEKTDKSLGMTRVEVICNRCDAHLGHVFDDGPKPTGLRYCINGIAMKFKKAEMKS